MDKIQTVTIGKNKPLATNYQTDEKSTPPPIVDIIIAIAQKVAKECPNQFEIVFKAIIDAQYLR